MEHHAIEPGTGELDCTEPAPRSIDLPDIAPALALAAAREPRLVSTQPIAIELILWNGRAVGGTRLLDATTTSIEPGLVSR